MPTLQAIIFDMDGTLADTEDIHRQAFNLSFGEFGLDWEWQPAEYHDLLAISGGKERIRNYLEKRGVLRDKKKARWKLADAIHKRKSAIYRELLGADHIRLRDGVERLISEAHRLGIDLGIATSSSRSNVETLLGATLGKESLSLFTTIVTCDVVEDKKPSPAVYQYALAELGRVCEDCVAIEDTRNGNLAARAAGLTTVITTHAYSLDNDFEGAALVVSSLGEPEWPFEVLRGDAHGAGLIDVALLDALLQAGTGSHVEAWAADVAVAGK